jgi:hypothetical protein
MTSPGRSFAPIDFKTTQFIVTFAVAELSYDLFEVRFLHRKNRFEYDSELKIKNMPLHRNKPPCHAQNGPLHLGPTAINSQWLKTCAFRPYNTQQDPFSGMKPQNVL